MTRVPVQLAALATDQLVLQLASYAGHQTGRCVRCA